MPKRVSPDSEWSRIATNLIVHDWNNKQEILVGHDFKLKYNVKKQSPSKLEQKSS